MACILRPPIFAREMAGAGEARSPIGPVAMKASAPVRAARVAIAAVFCIVLLSGASGGSPGGTSFVAKLTLYLSPPADTKKNRIPDHGGHASEKGRGACHSRRGKHGCACASIFSACTTATVKLWHSAVFGGSICHVSACGMEAGAQDGRLPESSTPEFDPNGRIR